MTYLGRSIRRRSCRVDTGSHSHHHGSYSRPVHDSRPGRQSLDTRRCLHHATSQSTNLYLYYY